MARPVWGVLFYGMFGTAANHREHCRGFDSLNADCQLWSKQQLTCAGLTGVKTWKERGKEHGKSNQRIRKARHFTD